MIALATLQRLALLESRLIIKQSSASMCKSEFESYGATENAILRFGRNRIFGRNSIFTFYNQQITDFVRMARKIQS